MSRRLLSTTRGQILAMLRGAGRTVADLARALHITENGVRSHLSTLERDGYVRQAGVIKGSRKPFLAFELTDEGERLFPKAYGPLLAELLEVLSEAVSEEELLRVCRETGRRLAAKLAPNTDRMAFEQRIAMAMEVLASIGAAAELVESESGHEIKGRSCPIADAVSAEPRACEVARTIVSEIVGAEAIERCAKGDRPRCHFVFAGS